MQEMDTGIPGFEDFYKLRAGELTILTGGVATGKTTLARQIAENVAIGDDVLRPGRLESITVGSVTTTRRCVWFSTGPVATPEPSVLTAHDVSDLKLVKVDSLARDLYQGSPFDLIVIDHLQGLEIRDHSVAVKAAKVLAMDLEVAVILVAQANKLPASSFIAGLRKSPRVWCEVADVVLDIQRPQMGQKLADGEIEQVVVEKVKDRRGMTPVFRRRLRRLGFTGGSFVSPT